METYSKTASQSGIACQSAKAHRNWHLERTLLQQKYWAINVYSAHNYPSYQKQRLTQNTDFKREKTWLVS